MCVCVCLSHLPYSSTVQANPGIYDNSIGTELGDPLRQSPVSQEFTFSGGRVTTCASMK